MTDSMSPVALEPLALELLVKAAEGRARRAARTLVGDHLHVMRQTMVALLKDAELAEHDSPGEATVYVISGHVELRADGQVTAANRGDLFVIPPERHSLYAIEDSAVLLTAIPREYMPSETPAEGAG